MNGENTMMTPAHAQRLFPPPLRMTAPGDSFQIDSAARLRVFRRRLERTSAQDAPALSDPQLRAEAPHSSPRPANGKRAAHRAHDRA